MSALPPTPENIFWDLLESEAEEAYYLDGYEENAELPAIIIHSPYSPFSFGKSWTVFFGRGIGLWKLKTKRDAQAKAIEIIAKSKWEVWPRVVSRDGRTKRLSEGYPVEPASEEKKA